MTILALIGAKALYLLFAWLLSAVVASWLSERKGYGERAGPGDRPAPQRRRDPRVARLARARRVALEARRPAPPPPPRLTRKRGERVPRTVFG